MYVETVPNRNSLPAILLRQGWREGSKTRKRTLANLSDWPPHKIETLRRLLARRNSGLAPGSVSYPANPTPRPRRSHLEYHPQTGSRCHDCEQTLVASGTWWWP